MSAQSNRDYVQQPGGGAASGGAGAAGRSPIGFRRGKKGEAAASSPVPVLRSRHFARLLLLAAAVVCSFSLEARSGASEWLLFSVTTAAVFIVWVLPYAASGTWTVQREQIENTGYEDGGHMRVRLKLFSSRPMPFMWVSIREEIVNTTSEQPPIPLQFRTVYIPWFSRSRTVTYTVTGLRRGELSFQPVRIEAGDLLSMTVRSFVVPCSGQALVLPKPPKGEKVVLLPSTLPGGRPVGSHAARIAAPQLMQAAIPVLQAGTGPDSRTYIPGDPLRRINWRAMARGLGMQTRIDQPELPGETVILLDASPAAYGSDGRLFDASVGRAAMAIHHAAHAGRNVTVVCGGRGGTRLRVRMGEPTQLRRALEELARMKADDDRPLSERLRDILAKLPRGADIICITAEGYGPPEAGAAAAMPSPLTRTAPPSKTVPPTAAGATAGAAGAINEMVAQPTAVTTAQPAVRTAAQSAATASQPTTQPTAHTLAHSAPAPERKAAPPAMGTVNTAGVKDDRDRLDTNLESIEAIKQAASLASGRGGVFYLWLGGEWSDPAEAERIWRSRLQGIDCRVSVLPIPQQYLRQPDVVEGGEHDGTVT
ncbi:DUF58 domain-containing protein [Paenibacillus mendelii]|uniref:DUF58 domain-containing protein n=1 Tax=Paenibacillus mendelii TaxID=206163 RepID=A0ABV6JCQ1_9BACL|nr:DUF58 domain-containing protein [Paenibacillus mendelii]MCQ6562571.1 DUF58 domain-containing protein [Paenibacillus mendelii]